MTMAKHILTHSLFMAATLALLAWIAVGCGMDSEETTITTVDPVTGKETVAKRKVSSNRVLGEPKDMDSKKMSSDGQQVIVGGTSLLGSVSGNSRVLYIIGGVTIIAGIVVGIWAGQWIIGGAVSLGGGAVIGAAVLADQYPWVFLVLAVVALAGVALIVYEAIWGSRRDKAVSDLVAGGERFKDAAPADIVDQFKTAQLKTQSNSTTNIVKKKRGVR